MVTGGEPGGAHIVTTVWWVLPVARCTCLTCGDQQTGLIVPLPRHDARWDAWLAVHRDGPCRPQNAV